MEPCPSHRRPMPHYAPLEAMSLEPLITRDYETRPALVYERLRQIHGPVAPVDLLGVPVWLVLGYREALEIVRNDHLWPKGLENWRAWREGRLPRDWPLAPAFEANHVVIQDGEGHRRLRAAWSAALKPFQDPSRPQAQWLKTAVTDYADQLIALLSQGGHTGWADLSAQFARPLPLMAASHLLGFPGSQGDDALMDMWRVLDAGPDAGPALERLLSALAKLGAEKVQYPGEDFPSYLLAAHPELTVEELARELMMLLGMVADFTGTVLATTVLEMISGNAGVRASLSLGMIREAMNRAMVSRPPTMNLVPRFPVVDIRLGNYTIAAGDPVWVSVFGTHADPAFAGKSASSSTLSTRAHLAWGAGARQCPAQELATTIVTVAVGRLFERFAGLELALPADQLPWRSSPLLRGLRSLPIRYELADMPPEAAVGWGAAGGYAAASPGAAPSAAGSAQHDPPTAKGAQRPQSSLWRYLTGLVRR